MEKHTQRHNPNQQPESILTALRPPLNHSAFMGVIPHSEVFTELSKHLPENIDFRAEMNLRGDEKLVHKHMIVVVIKLLLKTAKIHHWPLCKMYGCPYLFNGAYWMQASKDELKSFLTGAAIKIGVPEQDATYFEFSDKLLKQFMARAHLRTTEPDKNRTLINHLNGTLEVGKDGTIRNRAFSADDFLTYQMPFAYDEMASCPMFEKFLNEVLPDESSRMVLQEFSGFIFSGLNLEKCLVLLGDGNNGKSVFYNVLIALLGSQNVLNFAMGDFKHECHRAKLTDVLLNYSSERGEELAPDTFKALISGEALSARALYGNPFTLINRVRFIFNANRLPLKTERTEAYYRRYLIVPFLQKIAEDKRDIHLADNIRATELPGVLNWLLVGLKRIIQQEKFTNCEAANNALYDFKKQSDSVQLFLEDAQFDKLPDEKISLHNLFTLYDIFCRDHKYEQLGKINFSKELKLKGLLPTRLNDGGSGFFITTKTEKLKN